MQPVQTAQKRDALYYPYIHFRDVNWLKATLLCFPQVTRMVPKNFTLSDTPDVREFIELRGANGKPLIRDLELAIDAKNMTSSETKPVVGVQTKLLDKLQEKDEHLLSWYSNGATHKQFPKAHQSFAINYRLLSPALSEWLSQKGLAWEAQTERAPGEWTGVHPQLGEAIMSITAIAIAKSKGLDIVTSSTRVHRAILLHDEEAIFEDFLDDPKKPKAPSAQETVDEIALLVMTTFFDLKRLTPTKIAELKKEGKDLQRFKDQLMAIALQIPDIQDPVEHATRRREAAQEVIEEWIKYKKSLPSWALDLIVDTGEAVASALTFEPGVAIALTTWKTLRGYRKFTNDISSPYQYLSKIERAGASLISRPFSDRW